MRGCACRGTAGVAHVSCLTEQAKILVAEAKENNSDDNQGHRWYLCGLCKQDYHGDVRCALGWAVWKTYVGLPEDNRYRCCALAQLGTGLGAMGRNEEELSILEACWDIEKRRARAGAQVDLLAIQGKIANCYGELGRHPDALRVRREILAMRRKIYAPEDLPVLHDVTNLGVSLNHLRMYTESQPLWRKYIPVARRVLGRDHNLTTTMIKGLAAAISQHGDAPHDGLLEAIKMLSENSQRLRQVLGDTHPETQQNECSLKFLRRRLACLETKDTCIYPCSNLRASRNCTPRMPARALSNSPRSFRSPGLAWLAGCLSSFAGTSASVCSKYSRSS